MKVIRVPYCFYPNPVGGTEVYVESLSRRLKDKGIDVVVAAPGGEGPDKTYFHDGLKVRRFSVSDEISDLSGIYGEGDRASAEEFSAILEEEKPSLVHFHAFTRAVSLRLSRETRRSSESY